jgi:ribosomal protein L37E
MWRFELDQNMAPTGIDCGRCGNKGFSTRAGLVSHQGSSYCRNTQHRKAMHVSKKPKAAAEGSAPEQTSTVPKTGLQYLSMS